MVQIQRETSGSENPRYPPYPAPDDAAAPIALTLGFAALDPIYDYWNLYAQASTLCRSGFSPTVGLKPDLREISGFDPVSRPRLPGVYGFRYLR